MPDCMYRNLPFLKLLLDTKSDRQRRILLKTATPSQVRALSEIWDESDDGDDDDDNENDDDDDNNNENEADDDGDDNNGDVDDESS